MTGFDSKRQMAQGKLDDEADTLTIVYQRGFSDGKRAAQPEQEPDRRVLQAAGTHPAPCARHCEAKAFEIEIRSLRSMLYTTPPQRKPLTEEEMQAIWDVAAGAIPGWSRHIAYARAVEAAHGIKEQS
jgi:hypothetical protein